MSLVGSESTALSVDDPIAFAGEHRPVSSPGAGRKNRPGRKVSVGIVLLLVLLFQLLPLIVVVDSSFTSAATLSFPGKGFSTKWFSVAFSNEAFLSGIRASLLLGVLTAIVATAIGTLAGMAIGMRSDKRILRSGFWLYLLTVPLLLPPLVTGLGSLQFWSHMDVGLGLMVLVPGHLVLTLPYSVRIMAVSFSQVDPNIPSAAETLGAGRARVGWRVLLPLVRGGIVASLALTFLLSFDDVAVSLFLKSATFVPLPVVIFSYITQSISPDISAVSAVVAAGSVVLLVIVQKTIGLDHLFGIER